MRNKIIGLTLLVILLTTVAHAQIYRQDNLFNQGMGARPLAMGNAFTAIADDANAVFYNPAGLSRVKELSVLGLSSKRLADVDATTFLLAWPTQTWGTFALGTTALQVPSIALAGYDPASNQIYQAGTASYEERLWLLGWGTELWQGVMFGLNLKSYRSAFDADKAGYVSTDGNGSAADVGLLWQVDRSLSLGLACQNLSGDNGMTWSTGAVERFDSGTRIGIGYSLFCFGETANPITFAYDCKFSQVYPGLSHFGTEYWFGNFLALRAGLNEKIAGLGNKQTDYVLGLGLKIFSLAVDYAYYPNYGEETDTKHFLSVSGFFDVGVTKPGQTALETTTPTAESMEKDIRALEEQAAITSPNMTIPDEPMQEIPTEAVLTK